MGCSASVPALGEATAVTGHAATFHPRETRILQVEEVDTYKNIQKDSQIKVHFKDEECYKYRAQVEGEWWRGLSAGGSRNDLEMFARNPQYLLTVGPPWPPGAMSATIGFSDYEEMETYGEPLVKRCQIPVYISIKQANTVKPLHIAFFVYKAERRAERLDAEYFLCVPPVEQSGVYVNSAVVARRCLLYPGRYVLVSAAFLPHHTGTFQLTAFSDTPLTLHPAQHGSVWSSYEPSTATLYSTVQLMWDLV